MRVPLPSADQTGDQPYQELHGSAEQGRDSGQPRPHRMEQRCPHRLDFFHTWILWGERNLLRDAPLELGHRMESIGSAQPHPRRASENRQRG
jgi:hypothetical protein